MNMKIKLLLFTTLVLVFSSCAHHVEVTNCLPKDDLAGFWMGTWNGMTIFFSFIGSLFSDNIAIYAVNNNGAWYDFGFVGGGLFLIKLILKFIASLLSFLSKN